MVENITEWFGKKVEAYDLNSTPDFKNKLYRLGFNWDDEVELIDQVKDFFNKLDTDQVEAFIFGCYGESCESDDAVPAYNELIRNAAKLPNLKGLFFCDAEQEDSEISWISHGDIPSVLKAFPNIEELIIRGNEELKLGNPDLKKLKKLVIETGGLSGSVVRDIANSDFPELEHLELWLGTDNYGGDVTAEDLTPILNQCPFPKLKYLGIRNAEEIDKLAPLIANSPLLGKIKKLDLSLGAMTDEGANAFAGNQNLYSLESIDFHHHFLSDDMMKKLQLLPCNVNVSGKEEADVYDDEVYRYIAVSE